MMWVFSYFPFTISSTKKSTVEAGTNSTAIRELNVGGGLEYSTALTRKMRSAAATIVLGSYSAVVVQGKPISAVQKIHKMPANKERLVIRPAPVSAYDNPYITMSSFA